MTSNGVSQPCPGPGEDSKQTASQLILAPWVCSDERGETSTHGESGACRQGPQAGPAGTANFTGEARSSAATFNIPFRTAGVVIMYKELCKRNKAHNQETTRKLSEAVRSGDADEEAGTAAGLFVLGGGSTLLDGPVAETPTMPSARGDATANAADGNASQKSSIDVSQATQAAEDIANTGTPQLPLASAPPGKPSPVHFRASLQEVGSIIHHNPLTTLIPMALFVLMCGLGVWGVVAASKSAADSKRSDARSLAVVAATNFEIQLKETYTPGVTLDMMIRENPSWPLWEQRFVPVAQQLMAQTINGSIYNIQLQPFGQNRIIYPMRPSDVGQIGRDLLADPTRAGQALDVIRSGVVGINGPFYLTPQNFTGAFVRTPVYIAGVPPNTTFNYSFNGTAGFPAGRWNCSVCYNTATNTTWWGFVTMTINYERLTQGEDTRLAALRNKGYRYTLVRPLNATASDVIAAVGGSVTRSRAIIVPVVVPQAKWELLVEPSSGGWQPTWKAPLIAAVVIISFIITLLLLVALLSFHRQRNLLHATIVANRRLAETTAKLEEEKVRMDALLVRQYNLLACLDVKNMATAPGSQDLSQAGRPGITMERIEDMRRLVNHAASGLEDQEAIELHELLGEGAFGKVNKGLWRGTVVAIKTIILPANMTGAEKREKMAVMEAAISSSLVHPNIVTTYTYSIRPYREQDTLMDPRLGDVGSSEVAPARGSFTLEARAGPGTLLESAGSAQMQAAIHSYEVRLVLEYCDKGSLREALNQGAFIELCGVNMAAVLETASDIAKAMVHMHAASVLHSDLKARNIMLKSSGTEGRGITAKVADFGLSTRMSLTETHVSSMFQGTLTHMAPEVMLEGRISKAADVYAFGILLWELFTGGNPFSEVHRAHMGHLITKENYRPKFPSGTPTGYVSLAECCWAPDPVARPCFDTILRELTRLRDELPEATRPVHITPPRPVNQASVRRTTINKRPPAADGALADGTHVSGCNTATDGVMGSVQGIEGGSSIAGSPRQPQQLRKVVIGRKPSAGSSSSGGGSLGADSPGGVGRGGGGSALGMSALGIQMCPASTVWLGDGKPALEVLHEMPGEGHEHTHELQQQRQQQQQQPNGTAPS